MKCEIRDCPVEASFIFTLIESRRLVDEKHLCDAHAKELHTQFRASVSSGSGEPRVTPEGVCVDLEAIAFNSSDQHTPCCIYAHEVGGKRRFGMMVDGWVWWALMAQINRQPSPYPPTHAAWAETITELGGEIRDVVLDSREGEGRWSANLHITKKGSLVSVAVRAADAYILAVRSGAPIFVVQKALEAFADTDGGATDGNSGTHKSINP